uniref:DUF4283 domain-containing protein n=1 Tax=Tanacetum cinerariifolium TaxID=118510 RepID=A0A6L2M9M5_TANCI|nr:hypothetical protein [Tanacetum cinerariifolium]
MSVRRNRSKRKIRIPNRYEDIVCDLNKNKEIRHEVNEDPIVRDEQDEIRVLDNDLGERRVRENGESVCEIKCTTDSISKENNLESCNVSEKVKISYAKMTASLFTEADKTLCYVPTAIDENGSDVAIFYEELVNIMFDIPLEAWSAKGISTLASSLGKPLVMDDMTAQMCQYSKGRIGYDRVLVEVNACKEFKEFIEDQYKDKRGLVIRVKKIKMEYSWKLAKCNHCNVF